MSGHQRLMAAHFERRGLGGFRAVTLEFPKTDGFKRLCDAGQGGIFERIHPESVSEIARFQSARCQ